MHSETQRRSPSGRMIRAALALMLVAALTGCQYFIYIPLLIMMPFMPLIQFAIRMAARYGPVLIRLMVEVDPAMQPGAPPSMIAVEPANALQLASLPDLETRITNELYSTRGLRAVGLVEARQLTPAWLEEQCRIARAQGWQVRLVFADSRRFASGATLSAETRSALAAAGVRLQASEGLALHAAGKGAELLCLGPPARAADAGEAAVMAAMAGSMAPPVSEKTSGRDTMH